LEIMKQENLPYWKLLIWHDRVLIYPTKTMINWMKDHSKDLQPKTRAQFYVAITRAKYSVGIVFDYKENTKIEGVKKFR
jgi:DNA helicase-2/ATP-dependent DNA helicase PcrA